MSTDPLSTLRSGLDSDPSTQRPAGIEIRQDLDPAGGLPVQPPSYEGRLEIHGRHIDGDVRQVVELDSIGSSANRIEEVLLRLHEADAYSLPVSSTTVEPAEGGPLTITTLEAPHRVYDAWIRLSDAGSGDTTFEASPLGRELSLAHSSALDPLLETSAHDLLFGAWDSHNKGPQGQVRIGRSLTTTLIGLDPIEQARFAARRDPLNLGEASDLPKGAKKLSEQGLSSIPPQVLTPDNEGNGNGGVAISQARYLGFLSFAALRRLGFERYEATDVRVLLAALGLYGLALRAASGWDLRSGCAFTPSAELQLKLVGPSGAREPFDLPLEEAEALFREALSRVKIEDRSVQLKAGKKLNEMVDKAVAAGSPAS